MSNVTLDNQTVKTILQRYSCRHYKPEQIDNDSLEQILHCGFAAPSARNSQPWFLSVLQDQALLSSFKRCFWDIAQQHADIMPHIAADPHFDLFYGAPTVIFVFADCTKQWANESCALLTQNISLAAESFDFGTCTIGLAKMIFQDERGKLLTAQLGAPAAFVPQYCITLGHKASAPVRKEPRDLNRFVIL